MTGQQAKAPSRVLYDQYVDESMQDGPLPLEIRDHAGALVHLTPHVTTAGLVFWEGLTMVAQDSWTFMSTPTGGHKGDGKDKGDRSHKAGKGMGK